MGSYHCGGVTAQSKCGHARCHTTSNPRHCSTAVFQTLLCRGCRYDTLVAGGGDGTLNELVVALLKHEAPHHITVAQLPLGTANDLASAAGISLVSTPVPLLLHLVQPLHLK
jgi:diacylglycerol kinase family enzyme